MITQTPAQLRANVRKMANVQGTTALLRHPDADIDDYVLRAIGSFHRKLTVSQPEQRYLGYTDISTTNGTSLYPIPSDFDRILCVDLTANGVKVWLTSFEMNERPMLTDSSEPYTGIPFTYRLEGNNIEYLPTPNATFVSRVWYIPSAQQPTGVTAFDTISRLDDYLIAYAARWVAAKNKEWDLVAECRATCAELLEDIEVAGRQRDLNEPGRVLDVYQANRWGRRLRGGGRGWRR